MLVASVSFAGMENEQANQGAKHGKHCEGGAYCEKKAKIKEICKNDKEKCKQIKALREKHKAEMETLVGETK